MAVEQEAFLQQILEDRDQLYRETSRLKSQLSSFENFEKERVSYQQLIGQKDTTITKLIQQIEMLRRKIWGKSSERYINEDPLQRKLDFDGLDLLPEEKELATSAKEEIEQYKKVRVIEVKEKKTPCTQTPARKPAQRRNPHLS